MVGHHLVEGPIAVAEVRRREVDDKLGLGRHGVDDLEVQHRLALRLLGRAPVRVALDGEHGPERWKSELGSELVEIAEVRKVVDLGQHDGLPAAVEACVPQRLDVVVADDVGRDQAAGPDRVSVRTPVVVEAAHVADDRGEGGWKPGLIACCVKPGAVGEAIALDLDIQQRGGGRGRPVRGDEARGSLPHGTQAGTIQRRHGSPDENRIRPEVGGVGVRGDRFAGCEQPAEQVRVADLQSEAQVNSRRLVCRPEVDGAADRHRQRGRGLGDPPRSLLGRLRSGALARRQTDSEKTHQGDQPEIHGKVASQTSASDTTSKPSFR